MKKHAVLATALLTIAFAGCKSKTDQLMELQTKISANETTYARECPMVNDQGQPDMGGHFNTSSKCVEIHKHELDLQKQYADLAREASK